MPLTTEQRDVLVAFVDTAVPALDVAEDPYGFWATSGSATGAPAMVELFVTTVLEPGQLAAVTAVLDALGAAGLADRDLEERERLLAATSAGSAEAEAALLILRGTACLFSHATAGADGSNPFWAQYGYPGPRAAPPDDPPYITPYVPVDGEVLEADVVIIGSGAGGGTIAGVLASQGKNVVVLEAGGATSERDYDQLELSAAVAMMYKRGVALTADTNVGLLAGATLGGGTTVNWQNCVSPSAALRQEWAKDHGLADIATPDFDRHLDAVSARIGANSRCSDLNGPHQRLVAGAAALGWSWQRAVLNIDPDLHDPELAGYTQFGDVTGAKQSTLVTYLRDAFDAGSRILVHTSADRVLVVDGHAVGVVATYTDPMTLQSHAITVHAPDVVVAAGALETPAVLLRSGIGGPAVGAHLSLHPSVGMFGMYDEDQRAWWGPPQSAVMDEFRDLGDGHGLLVECSHYYPGVFAFQLARADGREHKEVMSRLASAADFLFILRDHGSGRVSIDADGRSVAHYALSDPRDVDHARQGLRVLAELHLAAGARELWLNTPTAPPLRAGDDLDEWLAALEAMPFGAGGISLGSAHQMGTARMGPDPQTSVADPRGELHDARGVWIGDASAFPTPTGANPMLTCMALAHRTAEHISGTRDEPAASVRVAVELLEQPAA
ncbi:MAG TPA: GMC family oxidoreductase [Mycobacteriales bacterium]|nr:GMC family oxidoreductase [Mycobacteriales bacterium]